MTGERAEKFFKGSEKHMDEWIKCLGVRCSGSIVDKTFQYTEHLLYPDNGGKGEVDEHEDVDVGSEEESDAYDEGSDGDDDDE